LAVNGGVDADNDAKADPGDTIAYTLTLANTSGTAATGLAIANPLDPHTTLLAGSLNSTPVAFDQGVTTVEDVNSGSGLTITLQGQDPDGSNLTFRDSTGTTLLSGSIATTHGTVGSFGSVSCDANGVCSLTATYTPAANYNGSDTFTFRVHDGTANSNEVGTVSITINPVNDAPTFTVPTNPGAVNEDAGATTVTNYISGIRPAQSGNATEDTQNVSFVISNITHSALFTAGGQPNLTVSNSGNQPFPLTANLTYTPAPNANGTSVVTYHLHDNGGTANSGVDNSADQTFTITVNAVNDAPVAAAKAFSVETNMKITGLSGLLTGVTDPDATNGAADPLSFDAAAPAYTSPSVTLTSVTVGTCTNGIITNVNTAGSFDFDPPPGVTASCVLKYQVTDSGKGSGGNQTSAQADITITFAGPVIWFVDPARATDGNGTLSNTSAAVGAFNKLSSANAKLATLATNQKVFIYNTAATIIGATEVLDLKADNDWLVGQGTLAPNTATPFDSFFSITPPAGTIARPTLNTTASAANTARPTVRGTVTARNNTQVTGVNIDVSGAAAGIKGLSGVFTSGTTLIKDVSVTSGTGNAVDLSGTQTVTFETSDQTNSPNIIISSTGGALSVVNSTIGANGFKFKSVTTGTGASGPTKGIALSNTGAGPLTITGDGSTANSGGIIQHTGGTPGTDAQAGTGAIDIRGGSGNYSFNFVKVLAPGGDGIFILNSTGTISIVKSTIDHNGATVASSYGLRMQNGSGSGTLTLDGVLVQSKMDGTTAVSIASWDTGNITFNVQDSNTGDAFPMKFTNLFGSGMVVGCGDNAGGSGTCNVNVSNAQFVVPASNGSNDLEMGVQQNSVLNFNIHDNTFDMGNNGANAIIGMINVNTTGSGRIGSPGNQAIINNNIIKNLGQSAALTGYQAIRVAPDDCVLSGGPPCTVSPVTHRLAITNNQIQNVWHTALNISARGRSNLNLQLTNNIIGTLANPVGKSNRRGVLIETQAASSVFATITGNTIVNAGTSNSNSALSLRSGTDNGEDNATGTIAATMSGNTIENTASAGTGGWFRAETITLGSGVAAGNMCLDYNSNTLKDNAGVNAPSKEFNLLHNSTGTFQRRNGGSNVGTETSTGTITTIAGGCTQPSFAMFKPEGSKPQQYFARLNTVTDTAESQQNAPASSLAFLATANSLSDVLNARAATAPVAATAQVEESRAVSAGAAQVVMPTVTAEARVGAVDSAASPGANAMNSLSSFANAIAAMIEPTAHAEEATRETEATPVRSSEYSEARFNHTSAEVRGQKAEAKANHADREVRSQRSEVRNHAGATTPLMPTPVGSFPINGTGAGQGFQLPDGKTITIKFKATLNAPPNLSGPSNPKVTAQATLTGAFVGNPLLSDDPSVGGTTDPTSTNVDLYDSTTTITSASPSNSTNTGQAVTFTATIGTSGTPNGSATNRTGTVNFKDNGASIGCAAQTVSHVGSNDVATCTTSGLATGVHNNITAAYSGDGNFDPSTSPAFTQTVTQSGSSTVVNSSANPSLVGQSVTFTAEVTSGGAVTPPTGSVQFHEGATNFGAPVALTSGGACPAGKGCASVNVSTLTAAGSPHTITADYIPDPAFTASSGNVLQTVNKSNTATALGSSANPSLVTQNVTFTGTVTSQTAITGPPAGTLTFKADGNPITCSNGGTSVQTLVSGSATCQVATLIAGSHIITADYAGDGSANGSATFNNSTGTLTPDQQVNKSNTTTTLSPNPASPAAPATPVIFTATVASQTAVTGPPAGKVQFFDGATPITCTGAGESNTSTGETLVAGSANCTTSTLSTAVHSITATYTGDGSANGSATFNGSTSAPLSYTVGNPCSASVVVTSNLDSGPNTLREAIDTKVCDGGTITFSGVSLITLASPLTITRPMTINGPGAASLTISGNNAVRIFNVTSPTPVTISGLTMSGGRVVGAAGGAGADGSPAFGGGLSNSSTLTLTSVVLSGNQATGGAGGAGAGIAGGNGALGQGGAIFNSGILVLNNCTLSGNTATGGKGGDSTITNGNGGTGQGGGVFNTGTLTLNNTSVNGANAATGGVAGAGAGAAGVAGTGVGGGIFNDASGSPDSVLIFNSTISGNTAGNNGGGIANVGLLNNATLTIINSTISGNMANNDGGGLYNDSVSGVTTINSSTITNNHADQDASSAGSGGGIRVVSGPVTLRDTIVAANFATSLQVETATVTGGPITSGVKQKETVTVSGGPAANGGDIIVTVTAAGLPGSPKSYTVTLAATDSNDTVASKIQGVLNGDVDITGLFTVTNAGPNVSLERNIATTNDATLHISIAGTVTGINDTESTPTQAGAAASAGTKQAETITLTSGPSACTAPPKVEVVVTAAGMAGSPITLHVPVTDGFTADQTADDILTYITTSADADAVTVRNFFTVTKDALATLKFTAQVAATNDGTMHVTIQTGAETCTIAQVESTVSAGGVAPTGGTQQVETVTVAGAPVTHNGNILVRVTASGLTGSPKTLTVALTTADTTNDAVADKIQAALQGDGDIGPFFTITSPGPDVVLTKNVAAANDATLHVSIIGFVTGISSAESTPTATGSSPGSVSVTVTANGLVPNPETVNVPVATGDTAADVANKIRTALNGDAVITARFMVSGAGADVVLTRLVVEPNDATLNIATANGTASGLTDQPTSVDTKMGGTATGDDISGTVDVASAYNLVGVDTGLTGITNGPNQNQVGTAGSPIDPKLDPLGNNGGPTQTHALQATSTALEKGINSALTTLSGGIDAVTTTVNVTSDANIPVGLTILVEAEQMLVTAKAANVLTVTRGANGTTAAPHGAVGVFPATDQRGFLRTVNFDLAAPLAIGGDDTDIGAYESQAQAAAPNAPVLDPGSDTGTLGDNTTADTSPTFNISGVVSGATVELLRDDDGPGGAAPAVVATGVAPGTTIQLTDPSVGTGPHSYTARQTVSGSATSAESGATVITIDTTTPATPNTPDLDATSDSGASNSDDLTNATAPVFTIGNVTNTFTVELLRDNVVVQSGVAAGSTIQLTDPGNPSAGPHNYTARQTNGVTPSAQSGTLLVNFDRTAPAAPGTPDLQAGSDSFGAGTGGTNSDNITNATTRLFDVAFTAEANSTVTLLRAGTPVATVAGTAAGDTSPKTLTDADVIGDNAYLYTVRHTDAAGNSSVSAVALGVTFDTAVTANTPDLQAASDSFGAGTNGTNSDNLTKTTPRSFDITGTESGSLVELLRAAASITSTPGRRDRP
jgi:hypothetical protein